MARLNINYEYEASERGLFFWVTGFMKETEMI